MSEMSLLNARDGELPHKADIRHRQSNRKPLEGSPGNATINHDQIAASGLIAHPRKLRYRLSGCNYDVDAIQTFASGEQRRG